MVVTLHADCKLSSFCLLIQQREEDKVNDDGEAQVQQRIHDNKNAERDEDDEILSEFDKGEPV